MGTIHWKTKYGINWENRMKHVSCPECQSYNTLARNIRSNDDGSMRQRYYFCRDCYKNFQTVEIDTERYLDLRETEQLVERAMKIEKAHKAYVEAMR